MDRFTPIVHKIMKGSGGETTNANIRMLGNVNHPPSILGNINHYTKSFNPHHHYHHK